MCGIVGYIGPDEAWTTIVEGLKRLEYRGYDSAGIAAIDSQGTLRCVRRKGKLNVLLNAVGGDWVPGKIGIGHTRWATHGRPSDENAHPHCIDDIALVHNGIIENAAELRDMLLAQGQRFTSETDTEVIAHLIALSKGDSLEERVRKAIPQLRGAYSIAVISSQSPDRLVVAKQASPLVIGVKDGVGLIASDIPALLDQTQTFIFLEDGDIAVIKQSGINITDINGKAINRPSKTIEWSPTMAEKGGYKHFMHKELHEQPRAMADSIRGRVRADGTVHIPEEILHKCASSSRIVVCACGSSWHAGLVARLAFEDLADIATEVELASELRYRKALLDNRSVVIAISQSGETADTIAAVKLAKERGATTIAIVNVMESSLARLCDHVLYTQAGPEIGVASTKALTTQMAVLILMAIAAGQYKQVLSETSAQHIIAQMLEIPRHLESILEREEELKSIANELKSAQSALFIGRSYGYPAALEGALKLKEISYIHAEGYAGGELKHGPIALVEPRVPIVAIATEGPTYDKLLANIAEVKAREGRVYAIGPENEPRLAHEAHRLFTIARVHPVLSPLLTTAALQIIAYHVADQLGADVDQPRNLAKSVTVE